MLFKRLFKIPEADLLFGSFTKYFYLYYSAWELNNTVSIVDLLLPFFVRYIFYKTDPMEIFDKSEDVVSLLVEFWNFINYAYLQLARIYSNQFSKKNTKNYIN